MRSQFVQNPNIPQIGYDAAILSVLPFPAIVFDLATSKVLQSNSFFGNERDALVLPLLAKYNYEFLDFDDFRKISKALYANQNYIVHKLFEIDSEIRTYEVHAYLLPGQQSGFIYFNLLSNHKLTDLNFDILGGWWQGIGIIDSKYRILINQLPFGVYRTSITGKFIYANMALAKILGYESVEELYKIKVSDIFINEDDRKKQLERWGKSIINSDEIQLKTKDDRIIYVRDTGLGILNKTGEVEFFDGIVEDITASVQMKYELMQARDKALESDRLKTSFLTNMSHEIRTPMNSILGFSSMLKRKGIHYHKREQYLDIIISRGKHLMQVLNDILDMTRIEENQVQVKSEPFVLNDMLEELYHAFQKELMLEGKPIKLVLHTALPTEDSLIITDSQHLQRVFSIIMNNAVKFTDEGQIDFGYKLDEENKLLFYVKDTGIGISPEYHQAIFERFRQADESFTRLHGGLGLGLSICKGLLKLMNGNVCVESDGQTGSTFYFNISYQCQPAQSQNDIMIGDVALLFPDKRVLVVEDDPASYEYLNEILVSSGCSVLHAANGKLGIEMFIRTGNIDLILLDIQLPEMDGYQFARKIREINTRVPIIAQTAHAMSEDRKKCLDAGCSCYLTKPINYDLLLETLKEFLC